MPRLLAGTTTAATRYEQFHTPICPRSVLSAVADHLAEQSVEQAFMSGQEGEGVQVASGLADRTIEVDVLDIKHDIASVLVRSELYHEYLHLVRTRDGWKIANALWCTP